MNKNQYPFWLRFAVFLIISSAAFFFLIFIIDDASSQFSLSMIIKIIGLAAGAKFLYNYTLATDPEMTE